MRAIWKSQKFLLSCILLGVLMRYTFKSGLYWLLAIETVALLFLFLREIVATYNAHVEHKKQKEQWELSGNRIQMYSAVLRVAGEEVAKLPIQTLRAWREWAAGHQSDEKARQALIDICTIAIRAPGDGDLDPAVRAEAQLILDELAHSFPTLGSQGNEPPR